MGLPGLRTDSDSLVSLVDRRGFLAASTALAGAFALKGADSQLCGGARSVESEARPRNPRPYVGIDWPKALRVNTTSHGHCVSQEMLDAYLQRGFGLMTISNYYPSAPTMPGKSITKDFYRFHQTHRISYRGRRVDPPKDWNAVIAAHPEYIDPSVREQYPLVEKGERMFPNWPDGLLEAPNAEYHTFFHRNGDTEDMMLHLCAPGSAFAAGSFDKWGLLGTKKQGWCPGCGEFWGDSIDRMIAGLVVEDGGGVTINHPTWSQLDRSLILDILDWDPRVLGLEVLEAGHNSEHYWDWVLATGRQCFGFFVPDWSIKNEVFGVNVLIVAEKTVEACLRAYRQGNFYGAAHGLGELAFTSIAFDGKVVSATVDRLAKLEVRTARGVVKTSVGTRIDWEVPEHRPWQGATTDVFARIKAYSTDGANEELFSQPFMLGGKQKVW